MGKRTNYRAYGIWVEGEKVVKVEDVNDRVNQLLQTSRIQRGNDMQMVSLGAFITRWIQNETGCTTIAWGYSEVEAVEEAMFTLPLNQVRWNGQLIRPGI